MKKRTLAFLAILSAFLALPEISAAGVGVEPSSVKQIVIQQGLNGYDRVADATIYSGAATTNYGAADTLKLSSSAWTGYQPGTHRFALKFDVPAALHDSASVVHAYVGLYQCTSTTADTIDVRRIGSQWNEGTGGNTGAIQSGNICWTNRYTGPTEWFSPGASYMGSLVVNQIRQYTSYNAVTATGDSSVIGGAFCGTDTAFNAMTSGWDWDVTSNTVGTLTAKSGAGTGVNRKGWVFVNVTDQVYRWQTGANEDDGFLFEPHNMTANEMLGFYSSNCTRKLNATSGYCYRPMLILRYTMGGSAGTTTVSATNRGGINPEGMGLR